MIRRALHGEIKCDFHVVLPARCDQPAEIGERAKLRMHRIVAAVLAADCIGAAGIVRLRVKCVVLALTVGVPDGMDRGEIKYVKANAAISGKRAMQSSNVPCRPGSGLWLRGTISYQAPARARARSATSGTTWLRVRSGRASICSIAAATELSSSGDGSPLAAKACTVAFSVCRAAPSEGIVSINNRWPSSASIETSWPALCFRRNSLRQVA